MVASQSQTSQTVHELFTNIMNQIMVLEIVTILRSCEYVFNNNESQHINHHSSNHTNNQVIIMNR